MSETTTRVSPARYSFPSYNQHTKVFPSDTGSSTEIVTEEPS